MSVFGAMYIERLTDLMSVKAEVSKLSNLLSISTFTRRPSSIAIKLTKARSRVMLRFLCEDIEFQAAAKKLFSVLFACFSFLLSDWQKLQSLKQKIGLFLEESSFAKAGRWVGRSFSSSFDYEGTNIKPHFRPIFLYF